MGPSPRSRGSQGAADRIEPGRRSIPAFAGEPPRRASCTRPTAVHPRVRGGAEPRGPRRRGGSGPSPRSRGSRPRMAPAPARARSIPAFAGEPCCRPARLPRSTVHPRVRGGATAEEGNQIVIDGPSPRSRGSPPGQMRRIRRMGSIPAFAGEPGDRSPTHRGREVHPRVRGGAPALMLAKCAEAGPSPRSRGSQRRARAPRRGRGSIPAFAGEPPARTGGVSAARAPS